MTEKFGIEQRLEEFAELGKDHGFTLRIWDSKVKSLEKEGIRLLNPKPTGRMGEHRYEIDFSHPIPGTMSERLYHIALQAYIKKRDG